MLPASQIRPRRVPDPAALALSVPPPRPQWKPEFQVNFGASEILLRCLIEGGLLYVVSTMRCRI